MMHPRRIRRTRDNASASQEVLKSLTAIPRDIAGLAKGCSDQQLHRQPRPDAWSARDVLAHLRACADVWGSSIGRMLAENHPTIKYTSPRSWIKKTDYFNQTFGASLNAFTRDRSQLLKSLKKLDASGWSRGATFTGTTLGRNATVLDYAKRIADHEVHHMDQIRRTLDL